ncbi:MAG: hypothetical protein IH987_04465 [Planctomycetes bacterium]|nr:hypothetical protein [Planctomycetota bacterium]
MSECVNQTRNNGRRRNVEVMHVYTLFFQQLTQLGNDKCRKRIGISAAAQSLQSGSLILVNCLMACGCRP